MCLNNYLPNEFPQDLPESQSKQTIYRSSGKKLITTHMMTPTLCLFSLIMNRTIRSDRVIYGLSMRTCVSHIKVNVISICNLCNSLVFMVMSNFIKLFYEFRTSSYLSFIIPPHVAEYPNKYRVRNNAPCPLFHITTSSELH